MSAPENPPAVSEAAAIAANLTEAQRRVLISAERNGPLAAAVVPEWAWGIHREFQDRSHRVVDNARAFASVHAKPMRRVVAHSPTPTETGRVLYFSLTPLGLAVRAHLLGDSGK